MVFFFIHLEMVFRIIYYFVFPGPKVRPVIPQIFLALLEGRSHICFLPILSYFPWSPQPFKHI